MSSASNTLGRYLDLIGYKAYADLKAEAARTYINYLWWILDPLMSLGVYYVVIGLLFERGGPGFIFVLLVGIIMWRWFSESISHATNTIMGGKGLMSQIDVPKWVFPTVNLVTDLTKFGFTLVILLVLLIVLGPGVQPTYIALPALLLVQLILIAGVAMVVAAIVPFIPDLRHIISTLLMLGMFMSGVMYDIRRIPEQYHDLFYFNPMARLINEYREILLHNNWPYWNGLVYVTGFGLMFLFLGLWMVRRFDKVYPRLN